MILIGIDVASKKHDVCIMSDIGEIFKENFSIPNKEVGYKNFMTKLRRPRSFLRMIISA